ncbi:LysR family transcriptional regulator [Lysobacter pythonis]|uniref:LysR family transcriptional regulator n=1 Tax=Solilutibacter pythonis TaxID=2483112 RepID=A0A3M2I2H6_9GAMM|nr:LysR family transcriptional regulator [Lysobacter pythonis]RMH93799.1 LysR family transcriptional regulator [Lysobacter pythonis]
MSAARFSALTAFAAVACHGSFSRAAGVLGVSASALSQSVRALEADTRVRLFNRTTRRVGLTEEGERFLAQVAPALAMLEAAFEALAERRGEPAGCLRINASRLAIGLLIEPVLAEFLARHPKIELDLHADDTLADLVAGGFDAGIRLGETLALDMVALPVGPPQRLVVVGAPDYLARHRPPRTPADLTVHECIRFRLPGSQRIMPWLFGDAEGREFRMDVPGRLVVNDNRLSQQAALTGAGLALQFENTVREHLAEGRLRQVLADFAAPPEQLFVYYPAREHLPLKLRAFVDFLRAG